MRKLYTALFILLHPALYAQSPSNWYKIFKGKIDKYPITLLIHKTENNYRGYYYYESRQQPVYFTGNDTSSGGSIQLTAYSNADENETFTFEQRGNQLAGTWKRNPDSQPLPFTASTKAAPQNFRIIGTIQTSPLRPDMASSPRATYRGYLVWPGGNSPADTVLKNIFRQQFLGSTLGREDADAIITKDRTIFFEDYRKEQATATDEEIAADSFRLNAELDKQLMICYQSATDISFAIFTYSYTGGAHGNYGTSYVAFDVGASNVLTLKDIITDSGLPVLNQLLEKHFRRQFRLSAGDSLQKAGLFENRIVANNNFYITGKGIGFGYQPYEIGPYVLGEINVFIPFADLKGYLKQSFTVPRRLETAAIAR